MWALAVITLNRAKSRGRGRPRAYSIKFLSLFKARVACPAVGPKRAGNSDIKKGRGMIENVLGPPLRRLSLYTRMPTIFLQTPFWKVFVGPPRLLYSVFSNRSQRSIGW